MKELVYYTSFVLKLIMIQTVKSGVTSCSESSLLGSVLLQMQSGTEVVLPLLLGLWGGVP